MIYYTADLHLGHANVIRHDGRPYDSLEEMDETLIENWNSRVRKNDEVFVVGDFCFRGDSKLYLKRLNGIKHLIIGNHDTALLKDKQALAYFATVDQIRDIRDYGKHIVLCHYPIAEWNGYYHGSYLVYGHIHNNKNKAYEFMKNEERALNAGCMINQYTPVTFEELIVNNTNFKKG